MSDTAASTAGAGGAGAGGAAPATQGDDRTVAIGDGRMPLVGYGTYLISNDDVPACVVDAIEAGYRHIDTAQGYSNEEGVGKGLKAAFKDKGVTRSDIFVTTKLWPGNPAWGQPLVDYDGTIAACNASLEKLQLDYVDLYLIHAPFGKELRIAQWRALVELKKQGKAKAIGVSNFSQTHIEELVAAGLPYPDANQIELHPWTQKPALVAYLREHGVLPIAYSSLAPLSTWRVDLGKDGRSAELMAESKSEDSVFRKLAKKLGVIEAQVLLRWGVQSGYPILPRSTNRDRVRQNIDVFSFSIPEEDMAAIAKVDKGDGVAWNLAGVEPLHTE